MQTQPPKLRYFAYGSNMFTKRLQERVPSCEFFAVASLEEYKLKFHKKSIYGSGKCDAYKTGGKNDKIFGVVFYISPKDKPNLGRSEGLGYGYNEKKIAVQYAKGAIETFMYVADEKAIDDSLKPYTWYKDFVVAGAKEHNLPNWYIKAIEAIPAINDSDKSREQRNHQLINTEVD
jgi:hypothetical protein